jgi:phasin
MRVNWNETGKPPDGPGDYADEVRRFAAQLMLERAADDRRLGVHLETAGLDEKEGALTMSSSPRFDVADDMRVTAERSVEQAKLAFDNYMRATEKAVTALESQVETGQRGALDISRKAMGFAESNVRTSFEFAHKIIQAEDIQDVFRMQSQFVEAQMQALREQVMGLGETINKAASGKR